MSNHVIEIRASHSNPPSRRKRAGALAPTDHRLARVLTKFRHELATALMRNVADWDKFVPVFAVTGPALDEAIAREIYAYIDFLSLYFSTGNEIYKDLYIGEKVKQFSSIYISPEEHQRIKERVTRADFATVAAIFAPGGVGGAELGEESKTRLLATLDAMHGVITAVTEKLVNVLLIGDCLYLDVLGMLTAPCLEDGIRLWPNYVNTKVPPQGRAELRSMAAAGKTFDLIFYSPFTYEYAPAYASLATSRGGLSSPATIRRIVTEMMNEVSQTLELVTDLFECPIFVHNSANVRHHERSMGAAARNLLTRPARAWARRMVNTQLSDYVDHRNQTTSNHLFLLDEEAALRDRPGDALGSMFYNSNSGLQHPAVMGQVVAATYRDVIAAQVHLAHRKLVVCDLDNTLWEGEIGEGAVAHYHDRQEILKKIRERGVVLAINSKNDPAKVHFDGAVLTADDFVCSQINWEPKVANMRRIQDSLNLKFKDYVFLDDRGDQRALVSSSLPEIFTMDATAPRTWRLLDLWATLLTDLPEADRTKMYHERVARENFVSLQDKTVDDPALMYASLNLRVTIRGARQGDLKRVVELINRTNQFNLAGSRTSLREVTHWQRSPNHRIIVVDGADRFGQMGTVCVAIIELEGREVRVPIFVLSCRVFGYGIETAVINSIRRQASQRLPDRGPALLVGSYRETAQNQPCRTMYPDLGFLWDDALQAWVLEGFGEPVDPEWLTIADELAPRAGTGTLA